MSSRILDQLTSATLTSSTWRFVKLGRGPRSCDDCEARQLQKDSSFTLPFSYPLLFFAFFLLFSTFFSLSRKVLPGKARANYYELINYIFALFIALFPFSIFLCRISCSRASAIKFSFSLLVFLSLSLSHSRSRSARTASRAGTGHVRDESRDCRRSLLIPARRRRRDWYRASERGHCTFSGTHATRGPEQQFPPRTPNDLSRVASRSSLQLLLLLLLLFLFLSFSSAYDPLSCSSSSV